MYHTIGQRGGLGLGGIKDGLNRHGMSVKNESTLTSWWYAKAMTTCFIQAEVQLSNLHWIGDTL